MATTALRFIGREPELATLRTCFERALGGHGQVALVIGEPGIGKTTLVQRLQQEATAAGAFVAWGRCWAGDGVPAFWPWMQLVRSVVEASEPAALVQDLGLGAAEIAQMVPEVRARLPELEPPIRLDPEQERFRAFESITQFLMRAAGRRPLVLVIDDLHWADPASARLLHFAARHLGEQRLLLVCTYRDTEIRAGHVLHERLLEIRREPATQVLPLQGLSLDEAREWMASVAGRAPADSIAQAIHRATAGNPFFMSLMASLLAEEAGIDPARRERDMIALPQDVMDAVGTRFEPLSGACRAVLEVAALVGKEFALDLLERIARSDKVDLPEGIALLEALDEAHAARLVVEARRDPASYGFAHDLVRESLVRTLPAARRIALHRAIGEAMARLPEAEAAHAPELAHHFREAARSGDGRARAIRWSVLAAEQAASRAAWETAVTQLRGALRLLESGERADGVDAAWSIEQARLLYQLGVAEIRAADPNADASFRRASAAVRRSLRAGGHPEAAELVARIALARHGDAIPADTIDRDRVAAIEEALGLLDETELRLRAELLAHKAILHCWAPDRTLVARLSRDAVEAAERCGDEEALFRALDGQQISLWNDPDAGKRLAILDRMQAIAARRGDPRQLHWCYYWRAVALAEQGRLTDADVEIEAQERIAERLREPHRRYLPAYLRAMRALLDGDRDRALALADQAFALGERAGVPDAPTIRAGIRIRAIFEEGGPLEGALAVMNTWPPERSPRGLEAVRALFLAESGEREKARALVDEIVAGDLAAIPREPNWVSVLVVLADAVAVTGAVEHAPVLRRHLEPYDGRLAIPGMGTACMGLVTRSLAQLAVLEERWDDAIAAFEAATRQAQQMGARAWLAILRVDHGLALVARTRAQGAAGDRLATATALLEQGRADAEALGMARVESMARRALEELGARRAGAPRRSPAAARPVARCRREGRNWSLSFEDVSVRVPDSKGMRYLAELFGRAGDAVHAIELELVANGSDPKAGPTLEQGLRVQMGVGSTDAALDARALREIRARLAVLRETIERAEQLNDLDRASRTREEIDFLTQQLAISVGLGGRRRRDGGDAAERARLRVTQRIKATLQALRGVHPALADHLARSVQTGVLCSYAPVPDDSPIWEL